MEMELAFFVAEEQVRRARVELEPVDLRAVLDGDVVAGAREVPEEDPEDEPARSATRIVRRSTRYAIFLRHAPLSSGSRPRRSLTRTLTRCCAAWGVLTVPMTSSTPYSTTEISPAFRTTHAFSTSKSNVSLPVKFQATSLILHASRSPTRRDPPAVFATTYRSFLTRTSRTSLPSLARIATLRFVLSLLTTTTDADACVNSNWFLYVRLRTHASYVSTTPVKLPTLSFEPSDFHASAVTA